MTSRILISGESWLTMTMHLKGFDFFVNNTYDTGVVRLMQSLSGDGWKVDFLPNHEASGRFPQTIEGLGRYRVVCLSDIGSNTLLLHPDTFSRSVRTPNRLRLVRDWVKGGGGLLMIGGYLSFQGIDGRGRWHGTPVEDALPVAIRETDDRVEVPEGFQPRVLSHHPILRDIPDEWPYFLGYNKVTAKPGSTVLMETEAGDPFLVVWEVGNGRAAAFTSDCAPHWGSEEFLRWKYYDRFWQSLVRWLAGVPS